MSLVRRETLRYLYEHGPVIVRKGAARSLVADAVYDILQERYSMGERGSVAYELGRLASARAIKEGDGVRHAKRHYLAIDEVGKRELATRLRQGGESVPEDLLVYIETTDLHPHLSESQDDDPIERLHQRQAEIEQTGPESVDVADEFTPDDSDIELDIPERPAPPQPVVDTNALAQALLAKVLETTREGDQWTAEIERLEAELAQAKAHVSEELDAVRLERQEARAALGSMTRERNELRRELDKATETHARLNETIGQVRAENDRLRQAARKLREQVVNGGGDEQTRRNYPLPSDVQDRLREVAEVAGLMRTPPGPGGDE